MSIQYSVVFSAILAASGAAISAGMGVIDTDADGWLPATAVNLAAYDKTRPDGIALTDASTGGDPFDVQSTGYVPPDALALVGPGADREYLVLNSSGFVVRSSSFSTGAFGVVDPLGGAVLGPVSAGGSGDTIDWAGDLTGSSDSFQTVAGIQGVPVSPTLPTNGQALIFNGSAYVPGNVASFTAGGDLTGTPTSQTVSKLQTYTLTLDTPGEGDVIQWNGTAYVNLPIFGQFDAGGDLSGTPTSQTVSKLQGITLTIGTPTTGQALIYNGTAFVPTDISSGSFAAGGDLTGSDTSQTVSKIQGYTVTMGTPGTGQALVYNGSAWVPTTLSGSFAAGGDLSGSSSNQVVEKWQGVDITIGSPTEGQIIHYNGSSFVPYTMVGDITWEEFTANRYNVTGIIGYDVGGGASPFDGCVMRFNSSGETPYWEFVSGSGTSVTWANDLAGSSNSSQKVVQITGASNVCTVVSGTALRFGSTPATTGSIGLTNNTFAYARNAANSANMLLIGLNSVNIVQIGDSNVTQVAITGGASGVSLVSSSGNTILTDALRPNVNIEFNKDASGLKRVRYQAKTSDDAPQDLYFQGQDAYSAASTNKSGGHCGVIAGKGTASSTGTDGTAFLATPDGELLVQCRNVAAKNATNRRISALNLQGVVSSSNVPGDANQVTFLCNATRPTTGTMSGGLIFWAESDGIYVRIGSTNYSLNKTAV